MVAALRKCVASGSLANLEDVVSELSTALVYAHTHVLSHCVDSCCNLHCFELSRPRRQDRYHPHHHQMLRSLFTEEQGTIVVVVALSVVIIKLTAFSLPAFQSGDSKP